MVLDLLPDCDGHSARRTFRNPSAEIGPRFKPPNCDASTRPLPVHLRLHAKPEDVKLTRCQGVGLSDQGLRPGQLDLKLH